MFFFSQDKGTPPGVGQATVIITGNEINPYIPIPQFSKALYQGQLDANRLLTLENALITNETFSTEIQLEFSGGKELGDIGSL